MFEDRYWLDADPVSGEPVPPDNEPELTEEESLAELERLIALDPFNRPEPSAAEIIARGESEPITPGLTALLDAIDPATLDEDLAIGYTIAADRVANRWHGKRALAAARATVLSPDGLEVPRELHAAGQLGAALGLGRNTADQLVTASAELDRLPAVRDAALAGNLTWRKTSSLATATLALTDEQANQVAEKVLPNAWAQPVGRFDAAVRKAVDLVDPDGIDARTTVRKNVIRLVKHHYGDGMGQLFADLPSEKLETIWLGADRWARRRKNDGDPRSLDELRVDALACWAASFLSHGDPSYCDRYCHPTSPDPVLADPDDPAGTG